MLSTQLSLRPLSEAFSPSIMQTKIFRSVKAATEAWIALEDESEEEEIDGEEVEKEEETDVETDGEAVEEVFELF